MFNVCPRCGEYSDAKTIDPDGPFAICPHCEHAHRFRQLPLFVVTGASGVGKSACALELVGTLRECVVLEIDLFWRAEFDTPHEDYYAFRNHCLRVAKNIGQAGRPVVLVGSSIPAQYEACAERRYFSTMHTLALVCDGAVLEERLRARPAWRHTSDDETLNRMLVFNRWFKDQAHSITLLDTSRGTVPDTAHQIARWVWSRLT